MKRPISFWRYCLRQELAVALGVLGTMGWQAGQELNRRHLNLHRADAERVQFHLQEHIGEAIEQFRFLRSLPPQARSEMADQFLTNFSDLYRLDPELKVPEILKLKPGSMVSQGFSFSTSPVAAYVRQQHRRGEEPTRGNLEPSAVVRAPEDEIASIDWHMRPAMRSPSPTSCATERRAPTIPMAWPTCKWQTAVPGSPARMGARGEGIAAGIWAATPCTPPRPVAAAWGCSWCAPPWSSTAAGCRPGGLPSWAGRR